MPQLKDYPDAVTFTANGGGRPVCRPTRTLKYLQNFQYVKVLQMIQLAQENQAERVPLGTSVLQIEKTYGHLLPDALERGRAALEAFDARATEAFGQLSGNAD
jgi:hypothetical protein